MFPWSRGVGRTEECLGPLPQLAQESNHAGSCLPGTAACARAGENPLFTSYVTSPLWFVSCLANLCPWSQVSLDERIWVPESKHITTPRKAILSLCSVDGESHQCTKNRRGQKPRGRGVKDTLHPPWLQIWKTLTLGIFVGLNGS